ncbi:Kinesin KIF15 [Micractinium conductrix]|uniref:Kinesin-like protein n=1 Tax=Micractinium conductrix TaxID=554055 RepID=A0A2P6V9B3_9CHLO|nr:Kinesin KIF15 [Micractinium conductrix]|eukprot:PSC70673.1 Kinesin KIF15 [Micractinium conductrix]
MTRGAEGGELRRAPSRGATPATSPRRPAQATPRKGRPGGGTATPGASCTPGVGAGGRTPSVRSRSIFFGAQHARAARTGVRSEPCSPRGPSLGDSCDGLEGLLPRGLHLGEDAPTSDTISVYVRVRPLSDRENAAGGAAARQCVQVAQERAVVLSDSTRSEPYVASYDRVFGPDAVQDEIYAAVGEQAVNNCLAGFNASIFVYGQTGAGKTFTITGDTSRQPDDGSLAQGCGLSLRVFQRLFDRITDLEGEGIRYTVKCSYVEVYNEELSDLLASGTSGGGGALSVREGDKRGVYVEGLTEHVAVNADDVLRLVQRGSANRHTAATRMNKCSSRSHSVFTAVVEAHQTQRDSGCTTVRFAMLNLIDLAGSERVSKSGATGEQLTEAKKINQSLTTLGRVVTALTEHQKHVPYRDSRLTFLLKDSLGGNSRTSIIACISPSEESAQETHGTLVFASGAKKIRNKAVINQDTVGDMKALQLENARLQRELAKRDDVVAAEQRQQLAAAQAAAAAAESRADGAEERQQQLEVALNESHSALQQRNAELALVMKEVEDTKATCQLLQKDREDLIDLKAALAERVEQLSGHLERSEQAIRHLQAEALAAQEQRDTAVGGQRAAEEALRSLQHQHERLALDADHLSADLEQASAALEEAEKAKKSLRREVQQVLADLRKQQREAADSRELAEGREERLKAEVAHLHELAASRAAQLHELEGKLANETVCATKYRRMVGEISKLIDWAQSTSPLPPTMGGRTSPAGYSSLMNFGRLSFGGDKGGGSSNGALPSPLGDATNQARQGSAPSASRKAAPSPCKPTLQVPSPSGRSPLTSPSKVR